MENDKYYSLIDPEVEKFRENFRKDIPWWYVPELHLGTNILIITSVLLYSFSSITNLTFFEFLVIPLMLLAGNFFVWVFHKYPLHRPFKIMPMAYKIHTLSHHHFYTDEAIIYRDKRDFIILFFPIHFVLPVNGILFPALGYFSIKYGILAPNVAHLIVAMAAVYLVLYEVFHFVSHLPEDAKILGVPMFKNAWIHHRHHHTKKLMGRYNFNIVFPLFDRLFKTYYR